MRQGWNIWPVPLIYISFPICVEESNGERAIWILLQMPCVNRKKQQQNSNNFFTMPMGKNIISNSTKKGLRNRAYRLLVCNSICEQTGRQSTGRRDRNRAREGRGSWMSAAEYLILFQNFRAFPLNLNILAGIQEYQQNSIWNADGRVS